MFFALIQVNPLGKVFYGSTSLYIYILHIKRYLGMYVFMKYVQTPFLLLFEKITFSFSQNSQSLRLWKSLTQKWIHSTIFEKLIIM